MDSGDTNQVLRYSHLGIQFALVIGVFCWVGYWLDGKLGSAPLLAFLGLVVGFSVAFYQLYQEVFADGSPGRPGVPRQESEGPDDDDDEGRKPEA